MGREYQGLALKAGVSIATVSHVLNGTRGTRPQTRQRMLAAIQDLGYAQNQAARNLVMGRSSLLGLIISDIRNPFFPEVTAAFQDQALLHNMDALVVNTNYDSHRTLNSVKRMIGLQVPAVAILTSQIAPGVMDMLADPKNRRRLSRSRPRGPLISNIVLDYERGIAEGLQHLRNLGHRRIAYIGGPDNLHSAQRRKKAYLETAAELGLDPDYAIDADFTVKGGYFACSNCSAATPPPPSWRPTISPPSACSTALTTAACACRRSFGGRLRRHPDRRIHPARAHHARRAAH